MMYTLPNGQCPTFDISLFICRPLFECFGCLLATNVSQIEEILGHKSCHTSLCLAGLCFPPRSQINPATKFSGKNIWRRILTFGKRKTRANNLCEGVWLAQHFFSSKMKIGAGCFSQQVAHCWPSFASMGYESRTNRWTHSIQPNCNTADYIIGAISNKF